MTSQENSTEPLDPEGNSPAVEPQPSTSFVGSPGRAVPQPTTSSGGSTMQHDNLAFEIEEIDSDYQEAPPSYDEVVNSTRYPIVRTTLNDSPTGSGVWRINFVDFSPHLHASGSARGTTHFSTLVRRANAWLSHNRDVDIITCETITWSSPHFSQLSETNVVYRSRAATSSVKTKYLRGLRLWFAPRRRQGPPVTLGVLDVAPTDAEETIPGLMKRLNKRLKERPVKGKLLTIETTWARAKPGKIYASHTYWTECMSSPRLYTFFLRIFFQQGPEPAKVEVGYRDFLPSQTPDSYENFGHVTEKASQWVADQSDVSIKHIQAVFVKKKGSPENCHNRCFYTEHPLKSGGRVTYFYQICRVIYTKPLGEVTLSVQSPPLRLTKKTFAPTMLPPIGEERESRFESFTKTIERVSSWLDATEAEVFAVETVPVRVQTAEQQRQGPEATFVWSMAETGRELESWLVFVRLYVQGEIREPRCPQTLTLPPIDWYRRQSHMPVRRTSNRKRNFLILCFSFVFIITTSFVVMYISYSFVV